MIILETTRLFLRELTVEDAQNLFRLNNDPDVIKYTGDTSFTSVENAKSFLISYDHYAQHGFGRWAVQTKLNSEFIGWSGLKYTPELDEFDIGFRFLKNHWNKGYATEAAKACLQLGFSKYKLNEIVGRALVDNKASIRVLTKLGLKYLEDRKQGNEVEKIYVKQNPA